jgi:hypothetical protein
MNRSSFSATVRSGIIQWTDDQGHCGGFSINEASQVIAGECQSLPVATTASLHAFVELGFDNRLVVLSPSMNSLSTLKHFVFLGLYNKQRQAFER